MTRTLLEAEAYEEQLKAMACNQAGISTDKEYMQIIRALNEINNSKRKQKHKASDVVTKKDLLSIRINKDIQSELKRIDSMDGLDFETFCSTLLKLSG